MMRLPDAKGAWQGYDQSHYSSSAVDPHHLHPVQSSGLPSASGDAPCGVSLCLKYEKGLCGSPFDNVFLLSLSSP